MARASFAAILTLIEGQRLLLEDNESVLGKWLEQMHRKLSFHTVEINVSGQKATYKHTEAL